MVEVAAAFPVGDRAVEVRPLLAGRVHEVLVDLGNLDAEGLEDALALHVREVLLTIFSWRDGSYFFDEKAAEVFRGYDHDGYLVSQLLTQDSLTTKTANLSDRLVERVFPLYSTNIEAIEVVRRGKVRRAKLYYLRDRRGRSARISEDSTYKAKAE